ncbi:MAG: alpha/beta hydrolase [Candidatus Saccharibacteria bacterium]|nr:alpha/beta hydrolase [Moraxellaceae bacterium]
MHVLFVHGMGRTPLSAMPILRRLKADGHTTSGFGYSAMLNDFESIRNRLLEKIIDIAPLGTYILIGHSLGGVLLRSALSHLPQNVNPPQHLFLLGSPTQSALLARKLNQQRLYRLMTGDCGQLLASDERMNAIGSTNINTTSIIGTKGITGQFSPFSNEPNDGIVAVSEISTSWISDEVYVPVVHTLLPTSRQVANILIDRLQVFH